MENANLIMAAVGGIGAIFSLGAIVLFARRA